MSCPDDAFLYELVHGKLPEDQLRVADAHLDECAECRDVVVELARATADGGDAGAELRRGSLVGRYVLLGVIGRGAMGVVYAAFDSELDRKVAIKLLHAGAPDGGDARVLREARAMAKLAHPNVVGVYDVGTVGDSVFVAMELVEGVSLREWLEEQGRGWRDVVDAFAQAARGLGAAHAAGLVHRDFKPDNAIVGPDGRVRVTDFGLARSAGGAAPASGGDALSDALTQTGAVVGTPAYMAPEQFLGGEVDARSDQFSFCVALFEALYGERPFRADSFEALKQRVVAAEVPEPGRSPAPRRIYRALARGLSAAPADRWASMDALVAALDRGRSRRGGVVAAALAAATAAALAFGLANRGAEAERCTGGPDQVARVWNPERAARIQTAFGAGPAYAAGTADRAVLALDAWRDDWVDAHRATCRATESGDQSAEALDARMSCLRRRLHEVDGLVAQLEGGGAGVAERALPAIAGLAPLGECADVDALAAQEPPPRADRERVAELERNIDEARSLVTLGRGAAAVTRARELADQADAIGYGPLRADALLLLSSALRTAGRGADAETAAFDALWSAEAARADQIAARAWIALIGIAGEGGRYDRAAHHARHAEAAVARVGAPPRLQALLANSRGIVQYNLGEYAAAGASLEQARALRVRELGEDSLEVARSHTALGNLARAERRYDDALTHHRRALAIDTAALGDDHPNIGRHLHNVAGVLRLQDEPEQALDHYQRALAIKRAALGDEHVDVALTLNSLGLMAYDRGDDARAREYFTEALAIFTDDNFADRAVAVHNLGLVLARTGDHAAALELLERTAVLYEATYGAGHERTARVHLAIGRSRLELGDRRGAREAYERAAEIARGLEQPFDLVELAEQGIAMSRNARRARRPKPAAKAEKPPAPPPRRRAPAGSGVYAPTQGWDKP